MSIADIRCPACGKDNWAFRVTISTNLKTGEQTQTNEEIRCSTCNKKAVMALESQIRSTPDFQDLVEKEKQLA